MKQLVAMRFWTKAKNKIKWNEYGFRWHLCTYRLNWARKTSRGWWDEWDDTALQPQDLKLMPWRSEKWDESGFRPPLCTYRLSWARRTSWGWWDDWDDTVLQTQDSKFEPWRSEAEHATSRSRRLPTILTFTRGWGRNIFLFTVTVSNSEAPV